MRKSLMFGALLGLLSAAAVADRERPFVDDPRPMTQRSQDEMEDYVWEEGESKPPPYPSEDDLVEFQVDRPGNRFRYFLDRKSLKIGGGDGVVHYTVVVASDSGARNVAYEGIRCETMEYKLYAYGGKGDQFQPVRDPQWRDLRDDGYNAFRRDLHDFYFCDNMVHRRMDEIQRALDKGGESKGNRFLGG